MEAGATHTGFKSVLSLTAAAASQLATAIKFQTLWAENFMSDVEVPFTWMEADGKEHNGLLYDLLKQRELTKDEWETAASWASEVGIDWFSTPDSPETIDWLMDKINPVAIKIAGGDMNYYQLIQYAAQTRKPVFLDARGDDRELRHAVNVCELAGNSNIVIVYSPGGYPTRNPGFNRLAELLRDYDYPIGYTDHSDNMADCMVATAMGAHYIEKCISASRSTPGIEHLTAVEPDEVGAFVDAIYTTWKSVKGDLEENPVGTAGRRSLVLTRDMYEGEIINSADLGFKRPGTGLPPDAADSVIGKKLLATKQANFPLMPGDVLES